jgi:putative membrane protein
VSKSAGDATASLVSHSSRLTPAKKLALAVTLTVFAVSWIAPKSPFEQAMHSVLTVIGLLWLWRHDRRWPLRDGHFVAICVFMTAHCIAARWLYSYVPYDQWIQWLTGGWSLDKAFGFERNHFDRLIHFLYGVCFAPAVREYFRQRWPALSARQAFTLAVAAIMCTSLIYEWIEWAIALSMSPEDAESYNGQQGDIWDAHTDMFLATLGSLAAWPRGRR